MSYPPAQELPECLFCNDFRSSDPLTLLDHQTECQKLPEHQGKYDEFMVNFVTSLARECTEERLSDLYKTENAARDPKLAARLAKSSDNKREKKGLKSVAPGTAVTTGNVEKAAEFKARDNGSGRGTGGKKSNKKGWSRGRGRGDRGLQPMGRGCGRNKSPEQFEQVISGGVVLKEGSQATADSKDSVITELNSFVEWMGLNMSTGRLARNDVTKEPREIGLSADAMKRSSSNAFVINEPRAQSRASYSHAGYSGCVQEGKGMQAIQEDVDKMALKRGIENSLNVYGEGSSGAEKNEKKAALDTDEVEGEVILYKGKNTSSDSDEVEGEVIVYKGRNYA